MRFTANICAAAMLAAATAGNAAAQLAQFNFDVYGNGQPVPASATGVPMYGKPILDNGGPFLQVDSEVPLVACVMSWAWARSAPNVVIGATGTLAKASDGSPDLSGIVCDATKPVRLRLRTDRYSYTGFYIVGRNKGGWRVRAYAQGDLDPQVNPPLVEKTIPYSTQLKRWASVADKDKRIVNVTVEALPDPGGEPVTKWGLDDVSWAE